MKRHAVPAFFHLVMDSDFTFDKDVEMDNGTQRASILLGVFAFLVTNVGCAALPWRAHKPAETITAEHYAQQAVENISYDDAVDFSQDYQSRPASASNYTRPTKSYSTASAGSSGSGSSGCCH